MSTNLNRHSSMQQSNFGKNIEIAPQHFHRPASEDEVVGILKQHKGQRIRCVGRRHSWSDILVSDDVLLDLQHLNEVEPIEHDETFSVRVGAGCQIKRLLAELRRTKGWTLPSVGFIAEQTVAGAIATGTHGSGRHSLSHYVISVRVARYDKISGQAVIEEISSGDALRAARCSLGCIGVILSITMQCRAMYSVEEHFVEYSALTDVLAAEEEFPLQQFYLVPWRWTYFAQHRRETNRHDSASQWLYHWYRFLVFDVAMHLLILFAVRILRLGSFSKLAFRWIVPSCVIRNWRVNGPSSSQLVMEHQLFRHLEIELFVRKPQLDAALCFLKHTLESAGNKSAGIDGAFNSQLEEAQCTQELARLRGSYVHHYPICVRKILPDDTLVSMASNASEKSTDAISNVDEEVTPSESWYSITLTNYHHGHAQKPFIAVTELVAKSMAKLFRARPHWGKLCPMQTDDIRELYPAFERFTNECNLADPHHRFRNQWTTKLLD